MPNGLKIVGRIGEKRLAEYAKMPLPGLFHEMTEAQQASKYMTRKSGGFYNPMAEEHLEAAMAKDKAMALWMLG